MNTPVLTFGVPGKPVQWRTGRARSGRTYVPSDVAAYRQLLILHAISSRNSLRSWDLNSRYSLDIIVHYTDHKRRDLENLISVIQDALNGVVWADDSQIDDVRARRGEPKKEGEIWVRVENLSESQSGNRGDSA